MPFSSKTLLVRTILNPILLLFLCLTQVTHAAEILKVNDAFSPEAPPVAKVLAAYMTLMNPTDKDVVISAVSSPLFDKVEIHAMEMKDGMMHMMEQKVLRIPAKGELSLAPGDLHIMLINKHQNLKSGDSIPITLEFSNGKTQTISVPVRKQH